MLKDVDLCGLLKDMNTNTGSIQRRSIQCAIRFSQAALNVIITQRNGLILSAVCILTPMIITAYLKIGVVYAAVSSCGSDLQPYPC